VPDEKYNDGASNVALETYRAQTTDSPSVTAKFNKDGCVVKWFISVCVLKNLKIDCDKNGFAAYALPR
jgi:hypothetical protein